MGVIGADAGRPKGGREGEKGNSLRRKGAGRLQILRVLEYCTVWKAGREMENAERGGVGTVVPRFNRNS